MQDRWGGAVLGFAVIDRQAGEGVTAVWLTTRVTPERTGHTNAVRVFDDDPAWDAKLRSLVADRAVVLTSGSTPPLALVAPIPAADIAALVAETESHQRRIVDAVETYAAHSRSKTLVRPDFPGTSSAPEIQDLADAPQRALATANYLANVWNAWLSTDEQRRRRTVDPRKGTTPWIMPEDMNSPDPAEFPPEFAARVRPQPVP
jgi:hypothetical protein